MKFSDPDGQDPWTDYQNRSDAVQSIAALPSAIVDISNLLCKNNSIGAYLRVKDQVDAKLGATSSCEEVYWQIDGRQWAGGCITNLTLSIGLSKTAVWHSIVQSMQSNWVVVERNSAKGKEN